MTRKAHVSSGSVLRKIAHSCVKDKLCRAPFPKVTFKYVPYNTFFFNFRYYPTYTFDNIDDKIVS